MAALRIYPKLECRCFTGLLRDLRPLDFTAHPEPGQRELTA